MVKHKPYLSIILLLIFTTICYDTKGNDIDRIDFDHLHINKLLPTNEVRNLYQDSEGYIWISTYNGLLRYDGYSIINYRNISSNSTGQYMDNFVNAVCEDMDHRLWIGTHNGLYSLDKETGDMARITSAGLHTFFIETVKCTSEGRILVGSNKGLFLKGKNDDEFTRLFPSTNMDVKAIMEDKKHNIWIGTWNEGLFRYEPESGNLYHYPDINPGKSAHTIYQDKNDNIWIGTWRYGLMKIVNPYDMERYSFVTYTHNIQNPNSISDNIVYTISQDSYTDNLWIGTRRGLSIMSADESRFTNYYPNNSKNNISSGEVNAILCSKEGLMWIGMLGGGISTVNTREKQFGYDPLTNIQDKNSTSVRSIFKEEGKDVLWIGIMGFGFGRYDLNTREFVSYRNIPAFSKLPYVSAINDITYNKSDKEFYISTWDDGVWIFDGNEVEVINQDKYKELTDVCVYATAKDDSGNLWIGTRSGLFILDQKHNLFSANDILLENEEKIPSISIFKVNIDNSGNIWVATPNQGIYKITPSTGGYLSKNYSTFLDNAQMHGAMTILIDSNDNVWAGTNGNGVNLYDKETDCFKAVFNELLEKDEVVYCMLEDNGGNLWITSNSKMYNIVNPRSNKEASAQIYTIEDGLQDYIFNRNACCKGDDGKLYFGGAKGLNIFSPEDIVYDKHSYPVVITDFKIYNTSIRDRYIDYSGDEIQKSLEYTDRIVISHKDNNFSIDFSLLNYINPMLNKYEFKLEGFDNNWIQTDADRHFAYYNNLPSGKYTFKVRGANSNGKWSENIRIMHITILPPPWFTWWAYSIYVIVAVITIIIIYRTITKRIYLQQMVELAKIQTQKNEEINHSKLQFFTNITHELLTPLTIISASVDDLKIHTPETAGKLVEIEDNLQRLIRLIQQILEFRKVENNKQQLKVSYGSMTQLIRHSCMAFAPLIRKQNLKLCFIDGGKDYKGYHDSDKLDKILYNLLSNAAKYTKANNEITIYQTFDDKENKFIFSVNNPGDVIPEEKLKHMFERFYEGDYRKFKTIGTGIGLSLAKDLTILHHGEIKVESDAEKGITFTVMIPTGKESFSENELDKDENNTDFMENNEEDIDTVTPSGEYNKEVYTPSSGNEALHTVLLVEDNEDLINVISRILSDHFHIIKARNGEQALEELKMNNVEIVVSDVMMDGMDGFQLCRHIKESFDTKHIPVILLTAKTSDQDRIEGYNVGADGYICKPLNVNVLTAKIRNLLKRGTDKIFDSRKQLVFEAKEVEYTEQDEILLKKVVECVNEHLDDINFDTTVLVDKMGMSRTTFTDKMKHLTGMTPLTFITSIRLQAAFRLLEEKKNIRITELAYSVGFNDPKYFSQCFKKKFGFSPKEYQKTRNEEKNYKHTEDS